MQDPSSILNPLANPLLVPVLYRTLWVFLGGFFLILILNKFNFKNLWNTNLGKRYLSWLFIGVIYLSAIFLGGDFALVVLGIILFFALWEVYRITKLPKEYMASLFLLAVWSVYVSSRIPEFFYTLPLLYYVVLSSVAVYLNKAKEGLIDLSVSLFVSIWIIFSLSHFVLLGHLNNFLDYSLGLSSTKSLLLLLGFAVPLSDVFAYVVGNFFRKIGNFKKIAANISPNKTYVGVLGNILGAGAGIWIMYFALENYLPLYHWIILAFIIGIMDVAGDLVESVFKRHYKVKDSGNLVPGHGGILDRIDSTLRVIITVYYYLLFFVK